MGGTARHLVVALSVLSPAGSAAAPCATATPVPSGERAVPLPGAFLDSPAGKLYYEVRGEGDALILLHDGLVAGPTWDAQFVPEAFPARFRVVRFDRRGRGRSEPAKVEHSDIDDLASLMDALAIPRAVLLGCSSGGALAIDFALAHPGRVTGLVLEGAVVSGLPLSDQFWRRAMENLRPMFESQDLAKTIDLWVNDPWLTDARNTAAVAFRGLLGPARQQAFLEAIAPYDSIRFLPQLAPRPLLLRFARRDESIAPWDAQLSILAAGERATVEWYDAGHRLDDAARASREAWLLRVLAAP